MKIAVGDKVECVNGLPPHSNPGDIFEVKAIGKLGNASVIIVRCRIEDDCKIAYIRDVATTKDEELNCFHTFRLFRPISGKSSINIF